MPLSLREFCSRCGRNGFVWRLGAVGRPLFIFLKCFSPYLIDFVVENRSFACILSISGEF